MTELAEAVTSRPMGRTPVVLGTHQFLSGANMRCPALLAGRDVSPRSLDSRASASVWLRDVEASDYLVQDDLFGPLAGALDLLSKSGIRTEVVLRVPVIGERAVTLVRVLHEAPDSRAPR